MEYQEKGDHLCLQHFINAQKSDLANGPDFVPSIYPDLVKKSSNSTSVPGEVFKVNPTNNMMHV